MPRPDLQPALLALALAFPAAAAAASAVTAAPAEYATLVSLFKEWRAFERPAFRAGVPDYTPAAVEAKRAGLRGLQARLRAIEPAGWPIPQQVDYQLVRAEMNGLDFDLRVLRPWSRNPCFYAVLWEEQSDTPAHEGHVQAAAIELWQYSFPLSPEALAKLAAELAAVPGLLLQARANLVEDARDLWRLGARVKRRESRVLADLEARVQAESPSLVPSIRAARAAVDQFGSWVEERAQRMTAASGVGIADYDWYLKHVQLSPYTWAEEKALHEREWARATAHLALLRTQHRQLPEIAPVASPAEHDRRFHAAVDELIRFFDERQVLTPRPGMAAALRERKGAFQPPEQRDFFAQVDAREPLLLRCHGFHWFDLARQRDDPHPSPIRSGPLLSNLWLSRAEGLATAMEELMLSAGLYEPHPRGKEMVMVAVANRAARGLAGLLQHSRELDLDQARQFAHDGTPYGWLQLDGETNWGEQRLYLEIPGYGTGYLAGKAQVEKLLAERQRQQGADFTLRAFMDEFTAAGLIPVSLIRWELLGRDDEIRRLTAPTP